MVGDAETNALSGLTTMNIDVLKVGHHGSDTSSPNSFLNKVDPEHSIISVGKNSYGHPSQTTLANLNSVGSKVYRTDKSGTIIVTSDGNKITVNKSETPVVATAEPSKPSPTKPVATKPAATKPVATKPVATKPPSTTASKDKDTIVYGTKTGEKYHKSGCSSLSRSKIPMTLQEAKSKGLTACSRCH